MVKIRLARHGAKKRPYYHIVVADSHVIPLRRGVTGIALAFAGFEGVQKEVGSPDLFGRPLEVTQIAVADELAAAASFLMGQADEAAPVVLVRGAGLRVGDQGSEVLIRPKSEDLFR